MGELSRPRRLELRPLRSSPLGAARPDAKLLLLPGRLARLPAADEEGAEAVAEEKRLETEPEKAESEASDTWDPVRAPGPALPPALPQPHPVSQRGALAFCWVCSTGQCDASCARRAQRTWAHVA